MSFSSNKTAPNNIDINSSQTLSNKTIASPIITDPDFSGGLLIQNSGVITLQDSLSVEMGKIRDMTFSSEVQSSFAGMAVLGGTAGTVVESTVLIGSVDRLDALGTGEIYLLTGDQKGTAGLSGLVMAKTGISDFNSSGQLDLLTGTSFSTNAAHRSGDINIKTGNNINATSTARTGNVALSTGNRSGNATASGVSGTVTIRSGAVDGTGKTGNVDILTGIQSGTSGDSGDLRLFTGSSSNSNSGDIILDIGAASNGTEGVISLQDSTVGVSGDVWTSINNTGGGAWITPAGGSSIEVQDEGTPLTTAVTKFNFAGAGVTVTEPIADEMLVTISGATAELDNLGVTAINAALIPNAQHSIGGGGTSMWGAIFAGDRYVYEGTTYRGQYAVTAASWDFFSTVPLLMRTQDKVNSDNITFNTGANSGTTGATGAAFLKSGDNSNVAATGTTGNIDIESGANSGSGNSGIVDIISGGVTTGDSGAVNIKSGAQNGGTGESGFVTISSGVSSSTGTVGDVTVTTGGNFSTTTGSTGDLNLNTGTVFQPTNSSGSGSIFMGSGVANGTGNSGAVIVSTGTANTVGANSGLIALRTGLTNGVRGKIKLENGSEGVTGHVWTSVDNFGGGEWSAADGWGLTGNTLTVDGIIGSNTAGKYVTLKSDNKEYAKLWFDIFQIKQNMHPDGDGTRALGISNQAWSRVNAHSFDLNNGGGDNYGDIKASVGNGLNIRMTSTVVTNKLRISTLARSTKTGDIDIYTGNSSATDSGNIRLFTGTGSTTRGEISLDTAADKTVLAEQPTGSVDLAVATTGYVNSRLSSTAIYHGTGASSPYAAGSIIDYDTVDSDVDGLVTTGAANWKYIAGNTGIFRIDTMVSLAGVVNLTKLQLNLHLNGSPTASAIVGVTHASQATTGTEVVSGVLTLSLTASDYLHVTLVHDQGGSLATASNGNGVRIAITQIE